MRSFVLGILVLTLSVASAKTQTVPNHHPTRARVFITDSKSWEVGGGGGGSREGFGTAGGGGARPQTAEIIKTFGERCSDVVVNNKPQRADYVVLLDHEGGKASFMRDNKVAVFNHDGDSILSHSTRSLGNAVKDACNAILADWKANGAAIRAARAEGDPPDEQRASLTPVATADSKSRIAVQSDPVASDIEVDGAFMGSTPSTVELTPGDHIIAVVKPGYRRWERRVKVTAGSINIIAELEAEQR